MKTMQFLLRALGAMALLQTGLCVAAEPVSSDRIATRNGVVQVVAPSHHRDVLSIDGKKIFAGPDDAMALWRAYRVGASDAVLFSTDCSGTTCGQLHFYFVLLKRGSKPLVITTPDFHTADGTFNFPPGQSASPIELGFENGLRKWAELRGSRVLIHLDPSEARISAEDCERVHQMALDNCTRQDAPATTCDFEPPMGSLADMGELRSLSNAPGFDSTALRATCHAQCATGVRSSFETFSREVCGIRQSR
jgi:hypothetical protein